MTEKFMPRVINGGKKTLPEDEIPLVTHAQLLDLFLIALRQQLRAIERSGACSPYILRRRIINELDTFVKECDHENDDR